MPLIHDEEYAAELKLLAEGTAKKGRAAMQVESLVVAGVLAFTILTLWSFEVPPAVMISVTISMAAVCIARVIGIWMLTLQAGLAINVGAIEWFGKKRLGEYEKHLD